MRNELAQFYNPIISYDIVFVSLSVVGLSYSFYLKDNLIDFKDNIDRIQSMINVCKKRKIKVKSTIAATASPPLSFPQYSVHLHPSPTDHWVGTNHA